MEHGSTRAPYGTWKARYCAAGTKHAVAKPVWQQPGGHQQQQWKAPARERWMDGWPRRTCGETRSKALPSRGTRARPQRADTGGLDPWTVPLRHAADADGGRPGSCCAVFSGAPWASKGAAARAEALRGCGGGPLGGDAAANGDAPGARKPSSARAAGQSADVTT
ncbi:hypothetical protein ACCO45_000234 [Purpureocillium lilacinum]|uniref:Uncharacterized protein n=1 Tax=Purpureocillium lilacinum TaxID=33203 RepID=A0ACC4E6C0_PURLI